MAGIQGSGKYITFEKPYLQKIADIIKSKSPLEFVGGIKQKVDMTNEIKSFVKAVDQSQEARVAQIIKPQKFSPIFNGYKWTEIEKSQFTGQGGGSDGASTEMQENATMFAIQKSIENNGYINQKKFYQLYRKDLLKIYPAMNEEWENAIFQQQLTTQREVGANQYKHYSRDDGFMEYIIKRCRTLYGITKKDTWNPADIWLVSDLSKVKRELDSKILDNSTSLQEFNTILRQMFHDRKVVGISLKLISGKVAKWELVNLENSDVFDNDEYSFSFDKGELTLSLNNNEFTNTDSKLWIGSKKQTIKFQIRQNSAGFNNLKIEGTDIAAQSARLGKVPLDMASKVFKQAKLEDNRWRSWQNYPTNIDEFTAEKDVHVARFNTVSSKIKTDCRDEKEFVSNMEKVFINGKKDIANSKLIQLDLLNEILKIRDKNKLNNLLTDLGFLAQKKGSLFGPFAKLY